MNVGGAELLIIVAILAGFGLLFIGLPIAVIVDAARRPNWQYRATGQSRILWIVLPAVGLAVCGPVSVVAAIVYFASVRPKLKRARPPIEDTWSYGYGPGYAPPPPPPPHDGPRWPGPPPG